MDGRLTITEVANAIGITPRTIMRWEKTGKIKKPKRDWRGWRFYLKEDLEEIKSFYESTYEYDGTEKSIITSAKNILTILLVLTTFFYSSILCVSTHAEEAFATTEGVHETEKAVDIVLDELPVVKTPDATVAEAVKYTLGPDDVISIEVRRHPEFSGQYAVNSEGKIEYKYIGDIIVSGLTKAELKERLTEILSEFLLNPEIDVQIVAYLSKVFYVVGDVNHPGKFYMKGDTVTVREALVQAGLPTQAAAMRRCRLITPNDTGKNNFVCVNTYRLLYEGDLTENLVMKPGEVLYVPATVVAKIIRVISPVTGTVGQVTGTAREGAAVAAVAAL